MENVAVPKDVSCRPLTELALAAERYVAEEGLSAPLTIDELSAHAGLLLACLGDLDVSATMVAVFINNALWAPTVAAVPFDRRILLLPQCLKSSSVCVAEMDEFGLLCAKCGACPMGALHEEAERLGYVVLVAEGTTVVRRLIQGGKIDAVIGVSCEEALRKAFPHMASGAIPGIAVPLDGDGCRDTTVDVDILRRYLHLGGVGDVGTWVESGTLMEIVEGWFELGALRNTLNVTPRRSASSRPDVGTIALEWMAAHGKRWRPFLAAAAAEALSGRTVSEIQGVASVAVAVECFHKASLVHDDIEDGDSERYGSPTLHERWGVPVALNTGDFLVGEGYRLISKATDDPVTVVEMLKTAAECHGTLCVGQGDELLAVQAKALPLSIEETLSIFRRKTSPAFYAAVALGAMCAGVDARTLNVLRAFCDALGISYQIKDDLEDIEEEGDHLPTPSSLSILAAIVGELGNAAEVAVMRTWIDSGSREEDALAIFRSPWVLDKAGHLTRHYKNEALRALSSLNNTPLASLLRKASTRLLD